MTAPEEIHDVTYSQFSPARHYGGCTAFGVRYFYDPLRDVLVRADIVKKRAEDRKKADRKAQQKEAERQTKLF